jgi:hypothetical protein
VPRWLAWTGRLLAGLLVLILLLVVVVYLVSSLAIRRTSNFPDSAVKAATDSASLAWGRHLVEAVATGIRTPRSAPWRGSCTSPASSHCCR